MQGAVKEDCQRKSTRKGKTWCLILLLAWPTLGYGDGLLDGKTLQADLDAGKDIALRPGHVVELQESLKFRKAGQRIETVGAKTALDYARIVHADGGQGTLIEANGIAGASFSKLEVESRQRRSGRIRVCAQWNRRI